MPRIQKESPKRLVVLAVTFSLVLAAFQFQQSRLQVTARSDELETAHAITKQQLVTKAARGEIVDRYGRPVAANSDGHNVVLNGAFLPDSRINEVLTTLIEVLQKAGEEWRDDLPVTDTAPYEFTDEQKAAKVRSKLGLTHYATAQNCVDAMIKSYKLQGLEPELQRLLMGIRYSMQLADYAATRPFTLAMDIGTNTMSVINEFNFKLPGVEIWTVPIRNYPDPDIAPHIMGDVGPILDRDWEEYKDKGYAMDDYIGRMGVEKAFEPYLKGKDGISLVSKNVRGEIVSVDPESAPQAGNTVALTLDKNLQKSTQEALAARIKADPDSNEGAVVVVDVKTGGLLTAANYPSYNLEDYRNNYEILANDTKNQPLFDRALYGEYPPGSTFKPLMALAALQTGVINTGSVITCNHSKTYDGSVRTCMGHHGGLSVVSAIEKSCNIFFYDCSMMVGLNRLKDYCQRFGLGVKTGLEVGETTGILPSNVPFAGIGQKQFCSPLQLAVMTATIANGGHRMQSHLLKEVKSYNLRETVQPEQSIVAAETGVSDAYIEQIKTGMLRVTQQGTARSAFSSYKIKVGGKTGTAQVDGQKDNAVFVAFAPFDKPEIAVAIVVKNGGYGSSVTDIARSVFDAYFYPEVEQYNALPANELLP